MIMMMMMMKQLAKGEVRMGRLAIDFVVGGWEGRERDERRRGWGISIHVVLITRTRMNEMGGCCCSRCCRYERVEDEKWIWVMEGLLGVVFARKKGVMWERNVCWGSENGEWTRYSLDNGVWFNRWHVKGKDPYRMSGWVDRGGGSRGGFAGLSEGNVAWLTKKKYMKGKWSWAKVQGRCFDCCGYEKGIQWVVIVAMVVVRLGLMSTENQKRGRKVWEWQWSRTVPWSQHHNFPTNLPHYDANPNPPFTFSFVWYDRLTY